MKKIMSTIAIACLSFSCLAESYFVKIADNEYVLQHREKSKDLWIDNSVYRAVYTRAVYTPTHVFTYPDETPSLFRNIQKIEYTKSNVTFYKDIKTRKCCIDILDDKENANKCRIIGMNGHEIINIKDPNIGSFEVYEVADEANSFTDSTPRLIYVDHTGLYIVSEKENPIKDISKNYVQNKSFDFKGEVIKVSAIDGKREMSGFDENRKEIFVFNCPSDAPVSFKIELTPFMKQIEEITGVKLVTPPPSEEAALKRMAEILDVPAELLVVEEGQVKLVREVSVKPTPAKNTGFSFGAYSNNTTGGSFSLGTNTNSTAGGQTAFSNLRRAPGFPGVNFSTSSSRSGFSLFNLPSQENPFVDELKEVIPLATDTKFAPAVDNEVFKRGQKYTFDTSPEAQQRRKEIALKPWDK